MARRKEDKLVKEAYRKERRSHASRGAASYFDDNDENFLNFRQQLASIGLMLRDIPGDGNCLFRALGDQLEGHSYNHLQYRGATCRYMEEHRADFEPFVEDDVPFERHINNLSKPGTYGGQDALVAFARLHRLNVVIHQLNTALWQIEGGPPGCRELHLSYHNGEHYASVRRLGDTAARPAEVRLNLGGQRTPEAVTNGKLKFSQLLKRSRWKSKESVDSGVAASSSYGRLMNGNAADSNHRHCPSSHSVSQHRQPLQQPSACDINNDRDSGIECRYISPDEYGVASVTRSTDDIVQEIMSSTGCMDESLVVRVLEQHQYNAELTTDYIVNLMILSNGHNDTEYEYDIASISSSMSPTKEFASHNPTAPNSATLPSNSRSGEHKEVSPALSSSDSRSSNNGRMQQQRKQPIQKKLTNRERKDQHRKEKRQREEERRQQNDKFAQEQQEQQTILATGISCLSL